ncbi:MAG: TolC family protein [Deltaproteobacteria bacterium]|nr:TolC family protein [Deltaproteobacteria bacterium]
MKRLFLIFFLLGVLVLAGACNGLKEEVAQPLPEDFPTRFSLYSKSEKIRPAWWLEFDSRELTRLEDLSLGRNLTLAEARARLGQARFKALKTGALSWPEVNLEGSRSRLQSDGKGRPRRIEDYWSAGGAVFYEVDLWGRIRALTKSELERYQASREDLKTAVITVSGAVAENWVELIANRRHYDLFLQQLELQHKLLQLVVSRFPLGKATALDVYQQQQIIAKLKTSMIPTLSNQKVLKRSLARLAGRTRLDDKFFQARDFPEVGSLPPLGLPADLLAARPDVRAAGLRLEADQWNVAAARADRLPAIRLTASGYYNGEDSNSLFDNWIINLAGNLTAPIFDGGRRRAEVGRTRAVVDERLATYRKTVINAVHEVENAMTREQEATDTLKYLKRQLELSRRTLREARRRYLNGNSDFINVLNEELNTLQLEHDIISQEKQVVLARIALYKTLGGSWLEQVTAGYDKDKK